MTSLPQPAPEPPPIATPQDVAFPAVIRLSVDATDLERHIFRVHQTIPVERAGAMTLLYPKWLPGYHSPEAQIELFAGLILRADGEELAWRRDPVEMHAFHIDVPQGAGNIEAEFQFLSPTSTSQGRLIVTPTMLNLQWNTVLLYPAGHFSRRIVVEPSVRLPDGWQFGCALDVATVADGITSFAPVALDVLVDSPMFAGAYYRRIALDDRGAVHLNIVADTPDLLAATDDQIAPHRAMVAEADLLFGARHFDRYEYLLALSDELGGIGVEHHRCCETATVPGYFTQWEASAPRRDTIAHEYTHSWNGKYRRGADSWTPTFERPIRNSLMWVYEGLTQYWGQVLATRAGLWSQDMALGALAQVAASYDIRQGRRWRAMSDTTRDPVIAARSPLPWASWQRSEDYYSEGQLVWLEIDTMLREMSDERCSLDDFATRFFGMDDGVYVTRPYDFDEVVQTLGAVVPYDWQAFLVDKLERKTAGAPLGGVERGGYRLVYRDHPTTHGAASDALSGAINLMFSLGLSLSNDGTVQEVIWGGPAFDAGLTAGSTILAIDDRAFGPDDMKRAITAAADGRPIRLLVKNGKRHRTVSVVHQGGLSYPHLEAVENATPRLDAILTPRRRLAVD